MSAELQSLAAQVRQLEPPARLHLAAELMTAGHPALAATIARGVADEIDLALARARLDKAGR